jgi:hypothetical protein
MTQNRVILKAAVRQMVEDMRDQDRSRTPKTFRMRDTVAHQLKEVSEGTGMSMTEIVERSIQDTHALYKLIR